MISTLPREAVITGSTFTPLAISGRLSPAKSITKRQEKYSRLRPTTPPMPVRVATTCASGEAKGILSPQCSR